MTGNDMEILNLIARINMHQSRIPEGLFAFDRNGIRMAIASIEDETLELYSEWSNNKRYLGTKVQTIRWELLDIAAVAMIAYKETFKVRT
jgi:hypothetical protein